MGKLEIKNVKFHSDGILENTTRLQNLVEVIEVDEEKLNPWYLVAFLTTDIGLKILKKAYIASLHSSLSIKKLEDTIIPILSIEEQNKIAQRYFEKINEIKEIKKDLNGKIQITKEIFKKYNGGLA